MFEQSCPNWVPIVENSLQDEDESIEDSEYNDLAEEYLNAIEAENAGLSNSDGSNTSGNVTVVESNRN